MSKDWVAILKNEAERKGYFKNSYQKEEVQDLYREQIGKEESHWRYGDEVMGGHSILKKSLKIVNPSLKDKPPEHVYVAIIVVDSPKLSVDTCDDFVTRIPYEFKVKGYTYTVLGYDRFMHDRREKKRIFRVYMTFDPCEGREYKRLEYIPCKKPVTFDTADIRLKKVELPEFLKGEYNERKRRVDKSVSKRRERAARSSEASEGSERKDTYSENAYKPS